MQATVTYTNNDDGVWLLYGKYPHQQEVNLDFDPTVRAILEAVAKLAP
jgi:hypothetical protein